MNGIFIYYKKIDRNNLTGIDKKVLWQVEQLNQDGFECDLYENYYNGYSRIVKVVNFVLARLPLGNRNPKWIWEERFRDLDYIYFRRPDAISGALLKLLKKIKKDSQKTKIIMEIPNFPYDDELGLKWYNKPLLLKDRYNRKKLKKYIDRIAVQNSIDEVYGVRTLQFINGIKIDEIRVRKTKNTDKNKINICAVASLEPWQGYERIILGLKKYYEEGGTRDIDINIVGIGSEMETYRKMTMEMNLNGHIHFLGKLNGNDLEEVYDQSDIALDAFGRYKTGNQLSTSLKSREYLAKGLPIVTGCKTDVLTENFEYFLEFPNDSSPVSIDKIIDFYDKIYKRECVEDVIRKIREYAQVTCNVSRMVQPIKDYLSDTQNGEE